MIGRDKPRGKDYRKRGESEWRVRTRVAPVHSEVNGT
jgi:hypothetical protein